MFVIKEIGVSNVICQRIKLGLERPIIVLTFIKRKDAEHYFEFSMTAEERKKYQIVEIKVNFC